MKKFLIITYTFCLLAFACNHSHASAIGFGYKDLKIGQPVSVVKKYCKARSRSIPWKCYGSNDKLEIIRIHTQTKKEFIEITSHNIDQFSGKRIASVEYFKISAHEETVDYIRNGFMNKYE